MSEEDWVKVAMTDDMLVADVLLTLVHAKFSQPPPPPEQSAKKSSGSPALPLDWSVRQRRSRQALKKKGETARASPATPLSWSGGTSVSGGGGADGSEESSRPSLKPVDNARSKVASTNETTPAKRSRRKKTLAELKEEMSLHLKENKSLKNQLEMVKRKFENLRTENVTLSRTLKFEKEKATDESSKRMKLEYQSHEATETTMVCPEPENAMSDLSQQKELACHPSNVERNENDSSTLPNGSSKVLDMTSCKGSFMLPDLNLPVGDDSGTEVVY